MKILAIADVASKSLWDYYTPGKLEGLDLILSAGDLPAAYLSFLVTFAPCPVVYVPGNHDARYETLPPEGCICADDHIVEVEGVKILGLGGSMQYNDGPPYQYTEKEMAKRIRKKRFEIFRKGGYDILLTHAPAAGYGDLTDLPHRGFASFEKLILKDEPGLMVHGHVHMNYGYQIQREQMLGKTRIINAFEKYIIEI